MKSEIKTPVAIYARYSTDRQDAWSIDDQVRRCREYAARHGMTVVRSRLRVLDHARGEPAGP